MNNEYQWQELLYMGFVFGLGFLGAVLVVAIILKIIASIIGYSGGLVNFFGYIFLGVIFLGLGALYDWFNRSG